MVSLGAAVCCNRYIHFLKSVRIGFVDLRTHACSCARHDSNCKISAHAAIVCIPTDEPVRQRACFFTTIAPFNSIDSFEVPSSPPTVALFTSTAVAPCTSATSTTAATAIATAINAAAAS